MPVTEEQKHQAELITSKDFKSKICEVCGEPFFTTRNSAKVCSNKCRQAAFQSGQMKKLKVAVKPLIEEKLPAMPIEEKKVKPQALIQAEEQLKKIEDETISNAEQQIKEVQKILTNKIKNK